MIDPLQLAQERARAEAAGDDERLLSLRELELALHSLPPIIDGARRARLVGADPVATTWEGWTLRDGQRVLLRCVRPRWRRDPVMLRRMARAVRAIPGRQDGLSRPTWHPDGEWPHLRVPVTGDLLGDVHPADVVGDPSVLPRLMAWGLSALRALHRSGRVLGMDPSDLLVANPDRPRLCWLDPFDARGTPQTDIEHLAVALSALDPQGLTPVGALAASWAHTPPPEVTGALALLQQTLAAHLLSGRHRLARAARRVDRRSQAGRLARLVHRLSDALPPPVGQSCLRAGHDGVLVLLRSDGEQLHGGAAADPHSPHLPRAWSREGGLEVATARALMRAWATRADGDEAARSRAQQAIGGTDAHAQATVRWLAGMTRLRTASLLLRAEDALQVARLRDNR